MFNLYIHLAEEGSWIEAVLLQGAPVAMNYMMCTYKCIFGGNK